MTTNRENRSLMRIVKQNRFKNLGELHKEWTEAGVKASRAPHTDVSRNLATVVIRGVLPGLREEELDCYPVVQSPLSDESKFSISFGNQGPRVWRKGGEDQSPSFLKSSVKFPQSVMIWGQCHLLVLVHCHVTAHVYQEILEHFMLPSADQLFKDADLIFQDLAPAHTAKNTRSWLNDHVLVCLIGQKTHQTWT